MNKPKIETLEKDSSGLWPFETYRETVRDDRGNVRRSDPQPTPGKAHTDAVEKLSNPPQKKK